jgi:hypothetical protein
MQLKNALLRQAPEIVCADDEMRENSMPRGETTRVTSPWKPERSSSRVAGSAICCSAACQSRSRSLPLTSSVEHFHDFMQE